MSSRPTARMESALRILVLTVAAGLASCIDSREEYWLANDGSGRVEITCSLPATVASAYGGAAGIRTMITGFLAATPELAASSCEVVTAGHLLRVTLNARFDSAIDLKHAAAGPSLAAHLAGNIQVEIHGRTVDFTRTISPGKALPGAAWLAGSAFGGHRLIYIIHLDSPATTSNATRVEDGGRTLVWDVPLAQAIGSPLVTHFTARLPIPRILVPALALLFALGGGFLWLWRRPARHTKPPPA